MDWKAIQKNIHKAIGAAQSMSDKVSNIANSTQKNLSTIRGFSEILNDEGDLFKKGSKLMTLAGSLINDSQEKSVELCGSPALDKTENLSDDNTCDEIANSEEYEILESNDITYGSDDLVTGGMGIESPTEAVKAIAAMGTEIAKAIQVCQIEETKRTEIRANMEVEVTRINAISKLLSDYLDKTFDERADLFDNYFHVLDRAIESGDTALMSATLGSINSLAAQSPFKDLADFSAVQQQLCQASSEWDI